MASKKRIYWTHKVRTENPQIFSKKKVAEYYYGKSNIVKVTITQESEG